MSSAPLCNKLLDSIDNYLIDINDYKIIRNINVGGFGIINLVRNKKTGKEYATKTSLIQSTSQNKDFILREAKILLHIQHPTIIHIYGLSYTDFSNQNNITILMDYMKEGSLANLINMTHRKEISNTILQIILIGISRGMMLLHKNHIIHRDLKPENILIDSFYRPHIADFGLSKFYDPDNSMNQSLSDAGTAAYMAPEVIESDKFNTKADIYSFGILMYEVITGKRAYNDYLHERKNTLFQLKNSVIGGLRPTIKQDSMKKSFQDLIEKCWSPDPKERPTFEEIYKKLALNSEFYDDENRCESSINYFDTDDDDEEIIDHDGKRILINKSYCLDSVDYKKILDYIKIIDVEPISLQEKESFSNKDVKLNENIEELDDENQIYSSKIKPQNEIIHQTKEDLIQQIENVEKIDETRDDTFSDLDNIDPVQTSGVNHESDDFPQRIIESSTSSSSLYSPCPSMNQSSSSSSLRFSCSNLPDILLASDSKLDQGLSSSEHKMKQVESKIKKVESLSISSDSFDIDEKLNEQRSLVFNANNGFNEYNNFSELVCKSSNSLHFSSLSSKKTKQESRKQTKLICKCNNRLFSSQTSFKIKIPKSPKCKQKNQIVSISSKEKNADNEKEENEFIYSDENDNINFDSFSSSYNDIELSLSSSMDQSSSFIDFDSLSSSMNNSSSFFSISDESSNSLSSSFIDQVNQIEKIGSISSSVVYNSEGKINECGNKQDEIEEEEEVNEETKTNQPTINVTNDTECEEKLTNNDDTETCCVFHKPCENENLIELNPSCNNFCPIVRNQINFYEFEDNNLSIICNFSSFIFKKQLKLVLFIIFCHIRKFVPDFDMINQKVIESTQFINALSPQQNYIKIYLLPKYERYISAFQRLINVDKILNGFSILYFNRLQVKFELKESATNLIQSLMIAQKLPISRVQALAIPTTIAPTSTIPRSTSCIVDQKTLHKNHNYSNENRSLFENIQKQSKTCIFDDINLFVITNLKTQWKFVLFIIFCHIRKFGTNINRIKFKIIEIPQCTNEIHIVKNYIKIYLSRKYKRFISSIQRLLNNKKMLNNCLDHFFNYKIIQPIDHSISTFKKDEKNDKEEFEIEYEKEEEEEEEEEEEDDEEDFGDYFIDQKTLRDICCQLYEDRDLIELTNNCNLFNQILRRELKTYKFNVFSFVVRSLCNFIFEKNWKFIPFMIFCHIRKFDQTIDTVKLMFDEYENLSTHFEANIEMKLEDLKQLCKVLCETGRKIKISEANSIIEFAKDVIVVYIQRNYFEVFLSENFERDISLLNEFIDFDEKSDDRSIRTFHKFRLKYEFFEFVRHENQPVQRIVEKVDDNERLLYIFYEKYSCGDEKELVNCFQYFKDKLKEELENDQKCFNYDFFNAVRSLFYFIMSNYDKVIFFAIFCYVKEFDKSITIESLIDFSNYEKISLQFERFIEINDVHLREIFDAFHEEEIELTEELENSIIEFELNLLGISIQWKFFEQYSQNDNSRDPSNFEYYVYIDEECNNRMIKSINEMMMNFI